jgi:peroxiredoxin
MKTISALLLTLGLTLQAAGPVPRPSPEFKILEPSGRTTAVSSLKGKVAVVQFLYTTCPHCQETARWLSAMQAELGPKGFAVYGVAFDVTPKDGAKAKTAVQGFGKYATFPVGLSERADVLNYLGISVMNMGWGVPQMVVIDKKGVIRAQTPDSDTPNAAASIRSESVTRKLVNQLLAEK